MKKMYIVIFSLLLSIFTITAFAEQAKCDLKIARSGCCSWHGGVCGCSGGRQICCDGVPSPSCTCRT